MEGTIAQGYIGGFEAAGGNAMAVVIRVHRSSVLNIED